MKIVIFTLLMIPGKNLSMLVSFKPHNILKHFILFCFVGTVTSISVTGYPGGVVNITCRYENKYRQNAKYVCKVQKFKCFELIKTKTKDEWVHSGRFSLYDNRSAAVLNVTIKDLNLLDLGTYRCVFGQSGIDSYTEVKLTNIAGE